MLHIWGCFGAKYLQSINAYLQNLQNLKFGALEDFMDIGDETVHLKNVKKLEIWSIDSNARIPLSFEKLDEFILRSQLKIYHLTEFVKHQTSLTKITYRELCDNGYLMSFVLPSLKEINIPYGTFSTDEVDAFISQCKLLKKITLAYDPIFYVRTDLEKYLRSEWRKTNEIKASSGIGTIVTLER